jgi:hypothetical protein
MTPLMKFEKTMNIPAAAEKDDFLAKFTTYFSLINRAHPRNVEELHLPNIHNASV